MQSGILKRIICSLVAVVMVVTASASAADVDTVGMTPRQKISYERQLHRDSVRAHKKVWVSVLGGPSYTPEASLGIAGAVLLSFKTNKDDSLSQRSFLPAGVNLSINGTFVVAGAGTLFFNANKFRIYSSYGMRNEPANFYGVGMDEISDVMDRIEAKIDDEDITLFHKRSIYMYNRFVWEVKPKFYLGTLLDINNSYSTDMTDYMANNSYVKMFKDKYTNIGLGGVIQYDSRDDVATPFTGMFLSATAKFYEHAFGGSYNYQLVDLEYRQFSHLLSRGVLAWTARSQLGYGDVPFTELPTFGSPFDLRGFYMGQYRDKSMGYAMVEWRQMFGTLEKYDRGSFWAKLGYVVWAGAGTLGATPAEWDEWRYNYGVGLRAQIQPRKNFRLDIGKGQGQESWLVYFNMTEAF